MRNRKKNEQKVKSKKNPWNTNKHTNIQIIEIPEKREKRKRKKKKEKLLLKMPQLMEDMDLQI